MYGLLALLMALTVTVLVAIILTGPRNPYGADSPSPRPAPPQDPLQLDAWLQASEAAYPDIRPGNAKGISWAGPAGQPTEWAVVYIHGFSAGRLETAPLADLIGQALGANVFNTRLSGHGRSNPAMAEPTVQDWLADTLESVTIGRLIGRKVLLLSSSTGGTLATWLGIGPHANLVDAYAMLSPNFAPKDAKADLINAPWGRQLTLALQGNERGWEPIHSDDGLVWNYRYPTKALFPMMALVKHVRESALERFTSPVLVLYNEADQTVSTAAIKQAFARFGSSLKAIHAVEYGKAPALHVFTGDARNPAYTATTCQTIVDWLQGLPKS